MTPARSWWGWGTTDRALPDHECVALAALEGLGLGLGHVRGHDGGDGRRPGDLDPAGVLNPGVLIDPV